MNDRDLIALCVWTEAQGEPADGMAAVVRVITNRVRLRYKSDGTVAGTILKPSQFSAFGYDFANGAYHPAPDAYTPGRIAKMMAKAQGSRVWSKCVAVVDSVLAGHYVGDAAYDRLTPDTVLYDNPKISHPAWAVPAAFVTAIGQHAFFRDLTRPRAPAAALSHAAPGDDALLAAVRG